MGVGVQYRNIFTDAFPFCVFSSDRISSLFHFIILCVQFKLSIFLFAMFKCLRKDVVYSLLLLEFFESEVYYFFMFAMERRTFVCPVCPRISCFLCTQFTIYFTCWRLE